MISTRLQERNTKTKKRITVKKIRKRKNTQKSKMMKIDEK